MPSGVPVVDIAGFAGLLFSVCIVIAIDAAHGDKVTSVNTKWIHAIFISSLIGLLIFPTIITTHWADLNNSSRGCIIAVDVLVAAMIVSLTGYYISYFRNYLWGSEHIRAEFPPDMPLF